jgi:hypothetical protein
LPFLVALFLTGTSSNGSFSALGPRVPGRAVDHDDHDDGEQDRRDREREQDQQNYYVGFRLDRLLSL